METVITRGQVHRLYYCGGCDHSWKVADDGKQMAGGTSEPPDWSQPKV